MQGMVRSLGPARRPRGAQGTDRPPCALNRGSPAPPPAERSGCSPAPAPSCGSPIPRGPSERRARGSQASPSEKTPRGLRPLSADAQGGLTWRLSPHNPRGRSELDLEGALFGLLEDQRATGEPWGQDPSKDRVMEILDRAKVLGRGARPPRTKDCRTVDPPTLPPTSSGPAARTNFPAAEVGGGGPGWRLVPGVSALLHLPAFHLRPAFAHPFPPLPRAPLFA